MGKRGAKSAQKEIVNIVQTSADVRPTDGIAGGSLLKETDTGNLYTFDESTSEWVLICTVSPSGGGGNPNTVQTITGTVSDPFGDVDVNELINAITSNNATVYVEVDTTVLSGGIYLMCGVQDYTSIRFYYVDSGSQGGHALLGSYNEHGLEFMYLLTASDDGTGSVTDIMSYASIVTTTLTIIWHPLPT